MKFLIFEMAYMFIKLGKLRKTVSWNEYTGHVCFNSRLLSQRQARD